MLLWQREVTYSVTHFNFEHSEILFDFSKLLKVESCLQTWSAFQCFSMWCFSHQDSVYPRNKSQISHKNQISQLSCIAAVVAVLGDSVCLLFPCLIAKLSELSPSCIIISTRHESSINPLSWILARKCTSMPEPIPYFHSFEEMMK